MKLLQKVITVLILSALLMAALPAQGVMSITVTNNNDSGAGSLREAVANIASGGTITFDGGYTIILASTLTINKNMTIDGTGHNIIISGGSAVQIMSINSGVTVSLNDLTFKDGKTTSNGGGILNNGALTVSNSTFSGNSAGISGGGIAANTAGTADKMVPVTVDDAVLFLSRLEGGAVCHFEATRMATGRRDPATAGI